MRVQCVIVAATLTFLFASADAAPSRSPEDHAGSAAGSIVVASEVGAVLDSNLMTGGGTDDTIALQRALDRAKGGQAVHLIIDGPALISGLELHSNTTIECPAGGGLYLKDDANRAVLRNANRSRAGVTDRRISVRGCFMNGNRDRQRIGERPHASGRYFPREADGITFQSGMQFFGVHYLNLENLTLWHIRSFGIWIANAKFVHLGNIIVDTGLPPFPEQADLATQREYMTKGVNDDGVHLKGPLQYVTVDGLKLHTLDDALALNANFDAGPYVAEGPITDVIIRNVVFMGAHQGIRFLSQDQRIDRILLENLTGTVRHRVFILSPFFKAAKAGNFGKIIFSNVAVDPISSPRYLDLYPSLREFDSVWDLAEEDERPLFSLNSPIEHLVLRNIITTAIDDRPVIRVGPDSAIQTLDVDINIHDPSAQALPIELVGGRIERLNLALNWAGNAAGLGKNPIRARGGTIGQLLWVNTPPTYVESELTDRSIITVTFSQVVKAHDLVRGVEIRLNGVAVPILEASSVGTGEKIRYRVGGSGKGNGLLTWAYDASRGFLQNLDGDSLRSVERQSVRFKP